MAPTKIICDPLFSRFNDECGWDEAIEQTRNKSLARNEGKLSGETLTELLLLRTPPSDLLVVQIMQFFERRFFRGEFKVFFRFLSISWVSDRAETPT